MLQISETVARSILRCNWLALAIPLVILLSACSGFDVTDPLGTINRATGTKAKAKALQVYGVAAGDDPVAVSVANSMLLRGGSAADAAAAMGFVMGVTYPSRAGLGGGGVCLAGGAKKKVQVLNFLPMAGTAKSDDMDRPSAIPSTARGMAALHAKHGRLPWRTIVAPAQNFAKDGFIMTPTFANDLRELSGPLFADPISRAIFSDPAGDPVTAGRRLRQFDLSSVLALISGRGAGEFYNGLLARRIVAAAAAAGGSLTEQDLREFLPAWQEPVSVQIGDSVLYAPAPPANAGISAIQMLQLAIAGDAKASPSDLHRGHLIVESAKRALGERSKWLGSDFGASASVQRLLTAQHAVRLMQDYTVDRASPGDRYFEKSRIPRQFDAETSFVVADGEGLVVACTLTMYHLFGTGRTAPGLGFLLAPAPDTKGRNPVSLGPVVITRAADNALRFAFSASGGETAATALANVMFRSLLEKKGLNEAIAAARLHYEGKSGETVIEDREDKGRLTALIGRGHKVRRLPNIGRVNAFACPAGLPASDPDCSVASDPRAQGAEFTVRLKQQDR